jgi:cell division protein FtsI (penicillin-binding protein 3)
MKSTRRLRITCIVSLAGFILIVSRLGYLQIYCHASLTSRAEREHARKLVDQWPRGAILDRQGSVLAMSIQGGACFADPANAKSADETARLLSPLIHLPSAAIKAKLSQRKRFVWLARRLDPATVQAIKDLHLPGVRVAPEMKRFYPEEALAAHLLGVVSDGQEGLSGVELAVDSWLTGRGVPNLFREWSAHRARNSVIASKADLPAQSVVLTIDRTLQTIVEQELATQMKLTRPKSGTVIIQDPRTGEILAMATAPGFNPNLWGLPGHLYDGHETLKNPAVEKVYEPGSTFKAVTASAAIEQNVVSPSEGFNCEYGSWQIPGRTIHDHEKEGWLTFTQIISHSSNIGTAKVAMRLGQANLYRYARAFGFGIPSGCGLPGDGAGILRPPKQWRAASLATISFGQEIGATPLQMVNAYSVIANGGLLLEPKLFKGVVDDKGNYREWAPRDPVRRVISTRTVGIVKTILRDVVDNGTGKAAQVDGISVAGKTGTAQKIDPRTRQYSPNLYLASFCGFAPVEEPRLVIGVFLDEPQANYWGGSEAAPLFGRIVRSAGAYLKLKPSTVGPLATARVVDLP